MKFDRKALAQRLETAQRYNANMDDAAYEYLAGRGITRDIADQFLLGVSDDINEGWLSIPYLRPAGVISFKFRRLDDGKPKYMGMHGTGTHLFNTADLDKADQTGEIAIAEGELDAITASALCDVPCVGIPGATQWTGNRHWWELFTGYQRVHILADPDEAGIGLATAIMETLPQARLVKLPGDVNETFLADHDLRGLLK